MEQRARLIRNGQEGSGPVIYWMSREQRASDNWGLLFAQQEALRRQCSLLVVFRLITNFLAATWRQYDFMITGLQETAADLAKYGIPFVLLVDDGDEWMQYISAQQARLIVTDFDPLTIKRRWLKDLTDRVTAPVYQVDGHNIIPCWVASPKAEYAAYTMRPKIHRLLSAYLTDIPSLVTHPFAKENETSPIDWEQVRKQLQVNRQIGATSITAGSRAGQLCLDHFLSARLSDYDQDRNDPTRQGQSGLSPYFHFGQVAPQRAAWEALRRGQGRNLESFLEELIIRRELADNFCYYQINYEQTSAFPNWARQTLKEHQADPRTWLYKLSELEGSQTHDLIWNRAQLDLVEQGRLHGYLRMYWAKKLLEWTESPEEALAFGIYLNDKYALDGRDPNGYAGLAWSIGGIHDRAFSSRPIFGKIRYMSDSGLKRKFNVKDYLNRQVYLL